MKKEQEGSAQETQKPSNILESTGSDYLFLWDLHSGAIHISGNVQKQYPIQLDDNNTCTIEDWYRIVYAKDLPALRRSLEQLSTGAITRYSQEYRVIDRKGNRVWVTCRGECRLDKQGVPVSLIGRISDMSLKGRVDLLTGAFNGNELADAIDRLIREKKQGFLLLIGVDNLKHVNLRHGREYGNHILKQTVDILEELIGPDNRIYRVNGDCFAVNLAGTNREAVEELYRALQDQLADFCTISAGAVAYHEHPEADAGRLYQYAEDSLDKAKRQGKNKLAFFSEEDYAARLSTIELQEELEHSVQKGFAGFSLRYQPQLRAGNYDLFGAEALLRYQSARQGAVEPSKFIPVLEQSGLIRPVGLWILRTALEQCRKWRAVAPDLHISVNMSYVQLDQEDIAQQVLDTLRQSGLPGEALTLEVTESMQLQDYLRFNKLFYQWKQAGIEISVDDFGTGYSSLGYLKNLDIEEIKIDRCFVRGIQHSAYNYRLLSNMLELARSSQIRVCCEGVETQDELEALEELKPDSLQGFLFNRPLTSTEFENTYIRQETQEHAAYASLKQELRRLWQNGRQAGRIPIPPEEQTMANILGALDEVVYVSDLVTYDLYYLNPAGRRLTGIRDYTGQKCYKVLQNRDTPCEFCTNSRLRRDSFYTWEWDNPKFGRRFLLRDKLISWQGKLARLELATDISHQESAREQQDFAKAVCACTKALVEEPDSLVAVRQMLAVCAEFYQSDRLCLFATETGGWRLVEEWRRNDASSKTQELSSCLPAVPERWMKAFRQNVPVRIDDGEQLRESDPGEWKLLQSLQVNRLLAVPVCREREPVGFLLVNDPDRCGTEDSMLRALSLFLSARLEGREQDQPAGPLEQQYRSVLRDVNLGVWYIRIDPQSNRREMFADATMCRVMGLEDSLSPQECYEYWYGRIKDGYYQYVDLSMDAMIRSGQVMQLEYPWQHPTMGEIMVRCTGVRTQDAGQRVCLQGCHRNISDLERPKFLPDTPTGEMFEFNEKRGSIYFHTDRALLDGSERNEENFPACWLEKEIVHPHFAKRFAALFHQVQQAPDVDNEEFMLRGKGGTYEWFKLRTRHLGSSEKDRDTILVLLDAADRERVLQLEILRLQDFYQASLSDSIAYAEVDLESGQLKTAGGLWAGYDRSYDRESENLFQFMRRQAGEDIRLYPSSKPLSGSESWKEILAKGEPVQRIRYQRKIKDEWRWVELVAHCFREQFTENMFALLYLKDIDRQVRKEQAQQEAANRDPLTGVYNRNAFEMLVREYMEDPAGQKQGALILLDIDDFKDVNDRWGHLEGDAALQYVSGLLKSTFRQHDAIGRLGGDEFYVFLEGPITEKTLRDRMDQLYAALDAYPRLPISCSAGIARLTSEGFSYNASLYKADMALYESKKRGKRNYTFAPE